MDESARPVMFRVGGAAKTEPLARIRARELLPAGLVQSTAGKSMWLPDRQAGHS